MVDEVILLTPLLTLGVALLLGFAGCGFTGQLGTPALTFRVRVPSNLTVTKIVYGWDPPGEGGRDDLEVENPTPVSQDGADNLFEHDLYVAAEGAWTSRVEVTVQGGASPPPSANGPFTLDGSLELPIATFQAMGGAPDLMLMFGGVTEGAMQPA